MTEHEMDRRERVERIQGLVAAITQQAAADYRFAKMTKLIIGTKLNAAGLARYAVVRKKATFMEVEEVVTAHAFFQNDNGKHVIESAMPKLNWNAIKEAV